MSPVAELTSGQTASHGIFAGGIFTLSVNITVFNVPLTSISWIHQGKILSGSEDRVIIISNAILPATSGPIISSLQISAVVEEEDIGNYTAIASHHTRNSTVQFTVSVLQFVISGSGELHVFAYKLHNRASLYPDGAM